VEGRPETARFLPKSLLTVSAGLILTGKHLAAAFLQDGMDAMLF